MNILLGVTGSVAATLTPKLVKELCNLGNVRIILTESATVFCPLTAMVYRDEDEWTWEKERKIYKKDDPVLHIELRDWADVLVIAPLTANTLAKMAIGLCDNLLTSVFRAWNWTKPVVVAPAMNTLIWENPFTSRHLYQLEELFRDKFHIVPPQSKMLACGDQGEGAMAQIDDIVKKILISIKSVEETAQVGDSPR